MSKDFLERIAPEVKVGGARNIVELAKVLRMPVETTRYKVKGMLKRGLTIHASIDPNKFGLRNNYVYFGLTEKARSNEKKFFGALSEHAYLISYARTLPTNSFACKFSAPSARISNFSIRRLIRGLEEEGLVYSPRVEEVTWEKAHMIQPEFFDLKHGEWRIDWNKLKKEPAKEHKEPSQISEFDELDLMIAKELESDALTRLSDIASALKTTLNNVFYHFHKHILEGKIIEDYVIRWSGTPKQGTVYVQFAFDALGSDEERLARASIRRLPFLWTDASSLDTGFYVGEATVAQKDLVDTLSFLSSSLGDSARQLRTTIMDARSRQSFPMPAHLYDGKAWKFDSETALQQVLKNLKK